MTSDERFADCERRPPRLATTYPRRFTTFVKWDPGTAPWVTFVPALWPLSVSAASRDEVIESVKKAIRSYVDRAAANGPGLPPERYEEVVEVEIEAPLKGHIT